MKFNASYFFQVAVIGCVGHAVFCYSLGAEAQMTNASQVSAQRTNVSGSGQTTGNRGGETAAPNANSAAVMMNSLRNSISSGGGGGASDVSNQRNQQLISSVANVGMGVVYWNIFKSSCGTSGCHAVWAIPLATEALRLATGQSSSAGANKYAADDLAGFDTSAWNVGTTTSGAGQTGSGYGDPYENPIPSGPSAPGSPSVGGKGDYDPTTPEGQQKLNAQIQQLRNEMIKAGVTVSPDGTKITTPDGRTFDTEKAAGKQGAAALQAMGMTPQEAGTALSTNGKLAKQAEEQVKKLQAKAAYKSSMSNDGGGAGAGAGGARGPAASDAAFDPMAFFRMQQAKNQKAKKTSTVSGLSKKMGDDSIGVAQDNIFEMITRRYQSRDQSGSFLKD